MGRQIGWTCSSVRVRQLKEGRHEVAARSCKLQGAKCAVTAQPIIQTRSAQSADCALMLLLRLQPHAPALCRGGADASDPSFLGVLAMKSYKTACPLRHANTPECGFPGKLLLESSAQGCSHTASATSARLTGLVSGGPKHSPQPLHSTH